MNISELRIRCAVCRNDWHRRSLEAYATVTTPSRVVYRVECESCSAKTALSTDAGEAIREWNAAYDKADETANPTPEFWAKLYGTETKER